MTKKKKKWKKKKRKKEEKEGQEQQGEEEERALLTHLVTPHCSFCLCASLCSFICSFAHSLNPELMLMIRCLNDLVLSHISMIHFLSNVKHIGKIILFKLKMYDQSAYPLAIARRVGATFLPGGLFLFTFF